MKFTGLTAAADIVGRRIQVAWGWTLDPGEALSSIPTVTIRRKERDWEFPAPTDTDPFAVYSDAGFPPAGTTVAEIELGTTLDGDTRTTLLAESASMTVDGVQLEVLRRTLRTSFDGLGQPIARQVTVLDTGGDHLGLNPGPIYCYQLTAEGVADTDPAARASAGAGNTFGHGRMLYALLPAVLRRFDTSTRPRVPGTDAIPEAAGNSGQLRRFIDLFGAGTDALRSSADGLLDLHDIDNTDPRFLDLLARWIGWDLSMSQPVSVQRHEIKYAAALYRITGTIPGCMVWVERLTSWQSQIKEFARNVMFTNDFGNPDDPTDQGSRTVDTNNAALLAGRKTVNDQLRYTYTTGTGPDDWYAYNTIGVFVTPASTDTAADVARKRGRLLANTSLWLPFNLRAVVIVELPTTDDDAEVAMGLQTGTDQVAAA
jgi:phage tail-like protein